MSYIYIYIYHPFLMFLDHTQRRSTVGRTPLDEWSARRRDLYLTTRDTLNRQISMPPVGFEPTISAGERPFAFPCLPHPTPHPKSRLCLWRNNVTLLYSRETLTSNEGNMHSCRSWWPRGVRRGFAATRLLGLRVRITPGAWMYVSYEYYVLSARGLCACLITRPEESYRVCVS